MSNNHKKNAVSRRHLAVLSILLACSTVQATELTAEFRAGFMKSDNIFLIPTDAVDSSIWTAGMSMKLSEVTARTKAEARFAVDYLDYADYFDAEWLGGLNADLNFALVPERLFWVVEETYGKQLQDPLSSPNPTNRENVNFFSTGPTVEVPIGSRYFFGLESRYSAVTYSESDGDDRRTSGQLGFGRRANEETKYGITVSTERVELLDSDIGDKFDINEAFLNYSVNSTRNQFNADVGYTEVDRGERKLDGTLARLDWTHVSSQVRKFLISLGSQYSTDGDLFRFANANDRDISDIENINGNGTPFRSNFLYGRYNIDNNRTVFALEAEYSDENYEFESTDDLGYLSTLDRTTSRIGFAIARDLTRKTFIRFASGFRVTDFDNTDRKDEDLNAELTFGFRFSDALNLYISGIYLDRESTDSQFNYTDNRYLFGMSYVPAWGENSEVAFAFGGFDGING